VAGNKGFRGVVTVVVMIVFRDSSLS
jgi:hypothetical protein